MRVSIIIPALNEAEGIAFAIERSWGAGADEVLVVDGGSSDGTADFAAEHRCRVLRTPPGRAGQQNAGAEHATGDVLLFLHADNWLAAGAVEQIRAALPQASTWGGCFRQRIESPSLAFRLVEWGNSLRARWLSRPYGDQAIFVRREAFLQAGKFPPVRLMEDLLLVKLLRKQGRPLLLPGPLYVSARRWERHGVLQQTARNWTLLAAARLGVSPDRLAAYYKRHDAT